MVTLAKILSDLDSVWQQEVVILCTLPAPPPSRPIPASYKSALQCPFLLMSHSKSLPLPSSISRGTLLLNVASLVTCALAETRTLAAGKDTLRISGTTDAAYVLSQDPLRKVQKWQKLCLLYFPRDSKVPKFEMASCKSIDIENIDIALALFGVFEQCVKCIVLVPLLSRRARRLFRQLLVQVKHLSP